MLALVNTHTAAALQYGYYRNFENRTETVLLYDLGATSVSAALVRFSGQHGNTGGSKSKGPGYVPPRHCSSSCTLHLRAWPFRYRSGCGEPDSPQWRALCSCEQASAGPPAAACSWPFAAVVVHTTLQLAVCLVISRRSAARYEAWQSSNASIKMAAED